MAKIYPTFTNSSYVISGYKSATYLDTFDDLILFQEKQSLVVFNTTTKKKTKIKISFGLSNACFLSETLILASSGNLVRVIDIATRKEIQQIIAPSQVTAINNYQTGFAVATKSECLTYNSSYEQTGVVELPVYEKAIISYGKLAIFSSESVRIYTLNDFSFSEYLSVGIPTDLFEYSLTEIIISTDQLKTLNLETGVVTNLDIGRNTKLYAEPSEEPEPTCGPDFTSSGNMILRYDTVATNSTQVNMILYKDFIYGGMTGSLTVTVSDGRVFNFVLPDSNQISITGLSGQGTITISGSISELPYYTGSLIGVLRLWPSKPIVEVIDFGEIVGITGISLVQSSVTKVPPKISPHFNNLTSMFENAINLNDSNITCWDMSKIKCTDNMFQNCYRFNQPINRWNMSNVETTFRMFFRALDFNQPIGNWNVSKITRMEGMFQEAGSFNQDISQWNTSSVTDMGGMFYVASSFDQPIGNWDVSNVTDMHSMFHMASSFNQPIGNWNVSLVEDFSHMFKEAVSFNQPIGNWNVSSALYFGDMFSGATSFNQDITAWNVSNATDFTDMFENATSFNQPIGSWNTSAAEAMSGMFKGTGFNQDISQWNTSNVLYMDAMFRDAVNFNVDISNWDVSSVEYTQEMFAGATSFDQPIGAWNTSSMLDTGSMFEGATSFNQDIGNWDVSAVEYMGYMFNNATSFNQNLTCWAVQHIPTSPESFSTGSALTPGNLPLWGQANSDPTGRTGASCNT